MLRAIAARWSTGSSSATATALELSALLSVQPKCRTCKATEDKAEATAEEADAEEAEEEEEELGSVLNERRAGVKDSDGEALVPAAPATGPEKRRRYTSDKRKFQGVRSKQTKEKQIKTTQERRTGQ